MSDEERSRTVNLKIVKESDSVTKYKAEQYDELARELATSLNEKYNTDLFSGKGMNQMMELQKLLDRGERKPASKGSVRLQQSGETNDPAFRQFDSPEEMVEELYKHAKNPRSEHYQTMKKAKDELWKRMASEGFGNMTVELERPPKGLPRNFTWRQYQEYLREMAQNAQTNKK